MREGNNLTETNRLITWLLSTFNLGVFHSDVVVDTPWSKVLKITTKEETLYLKKTPADLFIEPDVIGVIQGNMLHSATPKVLIKNPTLNCFLMKSCGNYSLRTKFKGALDVDLLLQGLKSYIKIQRSVESSLESFEAVGVPNWRINHFSKHYVNFIENTEVMLDEGFNLDEIDKLNSLAPAIQSICDVISECPIQDTLVNCDFNENNLIINETTQEISVIDLGETVISHPFFSIVAHLNNMARRYQLDLNGRLLESIRQKWLSCWLDIADKATLEIIYQNILRLSPIFLSLSLYRLQVATNNKSKEMQTWFIKDILQIWLENNSKPL